MKKTSRMESSKEVRRVLARHGADLSYCSYSCSGTEVRLTGSLIRLDGSNYNGHQVMSIIQDFTRHIHGCNVQGDMDNWSFSNDHISYLGEADVTMDQEEAA